MGFYLRKSKRIGPFRLNLSKSGLGVSAGVTGMRVSRGPRGAMIHMGRHGIYYRKSLGQTPRPNTPPPSIPESLPKAHGFVEIDSSATAAIVDTDSQSIVDLIRSTRKRFRVVWLALPPFALALIDPALLVVGIVAVVVLAVVDRRRHTTFLAYDITDETEGTLQQFYDAFEQVFNVQKVWNIAGHMENQSTKASSSASRSVKREPVRAKWGEPSGIETNVRVPSLPVGRQMLHFMPDMVLVDEGKEIGAVSYSNLTIEERVIRFVEDEDVPADAEVVGETWRHVNKTGGPDRRYKNNRELPVVQYLEILLKSDSGLNEVTQVSNARNKGVFREALSVLSSSLLASPVGDCE